MIYQVEHQFRTSAVDIAAVQHAPSELSAYNQFEYLPEATEFLAHTTALGNCALYGTMNRLTTRNFTEEVRWVAEHNYSYNVTVLDLGDTQAPRMIEDGVLEYATERALFCSQDLIILQDIDLLLRNNDDIVRTESQAKAEQRLLAFLALQKVAKIAAISKAPHPDERPQTDIHPWMTHFDKYIPFRGTVRDNPAALGRVAAFA